jgi:hypothetical protein
MKGSHLAVFGLRQMGQHDLVDAIFGSTEDPLLSSLSAISSAVGS